MNKTGNLMAVLAVSVAGFTACSPGSQKSAIPKTAVTAPFEKCPVDYRPDWGADDISGDTARRAVQAIKVGLALGVFVGEIDTSQTVPDVTTNNVYCRGDVPNGVEPETLVLGPPANAVVNELAANQIAVAPDLLFPLAH